MAPRRLSSSLFAILLLCLTHLSHSLPQSPASSTTSSATSSANTSTITDPGGVPGGDDNPTTTAGQNAAGAAGSSSSFNLSTGSIVAIIVVTVVVVLLGAASATLYFVAKKRQWKIAETMRRSLRRVASGLKSPIPRTPKTGQKMGFAGTGVQSEKKIPSQSHSRSQSQKGIPTINTALDSKGRPIKKPEVAREKVKEKDVEKGIKSPAAMAAAKRPGIVTGSSAFDMDSPVNKGGIWSKIIGRK